MRNKLSLVLLATAFSLALWASSEAPVVYVANQGIDKIQVVDTDAKKVIKEIDVAKTPHNITFSADKKWAFVASVGSGDVTILDVEKGTVAAKIPADARANGVALAPDGKELYVINVGADNVTVVDVPAKKAIYNVGVGKAPAVAAFSKTVGKRTSRSEETRGLPSSIPKSAKF